MKTILKFILMISLLFLSINISNALDLENNTDNQWKITFEKKIINNDWTTDIFQIKTKAVSHLILDNYFIKNWEVIDIIKSSSPWLKIREYWNVFYIKWHDKIVVNWNVYWPYKLIWEITFSNDYKNFAFPIITEIKYLKSYEYSDYHKEFIKVSGHINNKWRLIINWKESTTIYNKSWTYPQVKYSETINKFDIWLDEFWYKIDLEWRYVLKKDYKRYLKEKLESNKKISNITDKIDSLISKSSTIKLNKLNYQLSKIDLNNKKYAKYKDILEYLKESIDEKLNK